MNKAQKILSTLEAKKTNGGIIEDLDLAVTSNDRYRFNKILNSFIGNCDPNDSIKDCVDRMPKDRQEKLKDMLLDLHYDYDYRDLST